MIEVCSENIYYKKSKPKKKKRFKRFVIFFAIFLGFFCYYRFLICPNLINIVAESCNSFATSSINKAVLISLSNSVNYSDLVSVEKNSNGEIVYMSANSYKINYLSKEISQNSLTIFKDAISNGVKIPLGSFFGFKLFSGVGPNVKVKSFNVSSVSSTFYGEFKSVGINQTAHSIYINVKSKVVFNIPLYKKIVEFSMPILISETIIVGKVPDIYLNKDLFT